MSDEQNLEDQRISLLSELSDAKINSRNQIEILMDKSFGKKSGENSERELFTKNMKIFQHNE